MISSSNILSMILVGMFWGCTNPFLREGYNSTKKEQQQFDNGDTRKFSISWIWNLVWKWWKVWLPYLLNQCGSIVFYILLSKSDLNLCVPICNALSLVFSFLVSFYILKEEMNYPNRAMLGSILVMMGVTLCVYDASNNNQADTSSSSSMDDSDPTGGNINSRNGEL